MVLAIMGVGADAPVPGEVVARRVAEGSRPQSASRLLANLLELESSGHVGVERRDGYRFWLTAVGEEAAYELGPGQAADTVLVMLDLVGFVHYTAEQGDRAAHGAARRLCDVGEDELGRRGGTLVKPLGDGFLGTVGSLEGAVAAVGGVARRCERDSGEAWPVRAAVHEGRPIHHRGDLFGADVNLVARLCALAAPGELVCSAPEDRRAELVAVRGLAEPVPVVRLPLAVAP